MDFQLLRKRERPYGQQIALFWQHFWFESHCTSIELCVRFGQKSDFFQKIVIQGALKASYLLLFCSISETLHFFTFFAFFSHFCSKYHFATVAKTKLFVAFLMPLVIACWFCDFFNIFWFFSVFWWKNHAPLHIVQKSNK